MPETFRTSLRTTFSQSLLDDMGANLRVLFYNGTKPTSVATALSGNTLLATLIADATPSVSVTAGVLTFDTANFTQTNSGHVNGTPTWVSFRTTADVRVWEIDVGAGGMTFTGTIQANVDIARGSWTWTAPGA